MNPQHSQFVRTGLIVVILLLLVFIALRNTAGPSLAPGAQPQWSLTTLTGEQIDQSTYAGKLVVIEFWATWCGPCVALAPQLKELQKTYKTQGVHFISVSLDTNLEAQKQFIGEHNLDWTHANDQQQSESIANIFGVSAIPWAFVLSPDSAVIWSGHGGQLEEVLPQAVREYSPTVASR